MLDREMNQGAPHLVLWSSSNSLRSFCYLTHFQCEIIGPIQFSDL